jgi:hypothetical protein
VLREMRQERLAGNAKEEAPLLLGKGHAHEPAAESAAET